MSLSQDIEYRKDVVEIIHYCSEINESLQETDNANELKTIFKLFQTDFNVFIEKVQERAYEYRLAPFWLDFNFSKIIKRINKLDNEQIWSFAHYFNNRYRRQIYDKLFPEKDFIIKLREQVDMPTIRRKRRNLHNACLDYLSKCLKECEQNFPE